MSESETYWADTDILPAYPRLDTDISADVVIIGAGNTGIASAYFLSQNGLKVVLLDAGFVCCGGTGRSTAHLTCVTDKRLYQLVSEFGQSYAHHVWRAGQSAIGIVESLIDKRA